MVRQTTADDDNASTGSGIFFAHRTAKFRERGQFILLLIIAITCMIYLMMEFRLVLRPLVWAMICVMALSPITARVEYVFTRFCVWCCYKKKKRRMDWSAKEHRSDDVTPSVIGKQSLESDIFSFAPSTRTNFEEKSMCFPRFCSVFASIIVMLIVVSGFTLLVFESVVHMKQNIHYYELGAQRMVNETSIVIKATKLQLPDSITKDFTQNLIKTGEDWARNSIAGVIENIGRFMAEAMMMALYITFWLCAPMPTNESTQFLFQRYIFLKSAVCFAYGSAVGILLYILKVDLALVFGLTTFLFNFVPEIGAAIAILLPIPIILLDNRLERPYLTVIIAFFGQMFLKFLFGNIVEVKFIESDSLMRMHPVVILVGVAFFGYIWGPTGMLVSVPLMGYVKLAILSDNVPPAYRDPVLIFLEGDKHAPKRNVIRRAKFRSSEFNAVPPAELSPRNLETISRESCEPLNTPRSRRYDHQKDSEVELQNLSCIQRLTSTPSLQIISGQPEYRNESTTKNPDNLANMI